ncbi:MAG: Lrp/AsnC ligand binding domain-containing protein [Candidatus Bathyarchaeota archaeon]|nr:Lrp/AsnC ligand binding domain-containing protein [Candidatus Bathyarchaeota archaeon]MDH5495600.1 Lrp/AsnC ligand binding domain-containing protein [Candidatus Bathyarchaeota archaeon]
MPVAFVLINTEIGSESEVLETLKNVEGVVEAYAVYGVYDVVAKITADTMDKLKETVTWHVRRLDKVRSTLTMIVVEEPGA